MATSVHQANRCSICFVDADEQNSWPPSDPNDARRLDVNYDDDDHELILPETPWTYENGDLNPNLAPSNSRRKSSSARRRRRVPIANVPPYHPDYVEPNTTTFRDGVPENSDGYETVSEEDNDEYVDKERSGHIVRRGSEGYEIRPVDREEILRRYIASRSEEAGWYNQYVPEPGSDSDSGIGGWEDEPGGEDANVRAAALA